MFSKKIDIAAENLNKEINSLILELSKYKKTDTEYGVIANYIIKLYALKNDNVPTRMSTDAKATIAANLAGIGLILGYERAHVVTSKALSFIQKLR